VYNLFGYGSLIEHVICVCKINILNYTTWKHKFILLRLSGMEKNVLYFILYQDERVDVPYLQSHSLCVCDVLL